MESEPQNSEFRNNTDSFHPCLYSSRLFRPEIVMKANIMNLDQTAPLGAV